jgi:23S rRNA pseudouridine1911/1915/1917 synthase
MPSPFLLDRLFGVDDILSHGCGLHLIGDSMRRAFGRRKPGVLSRVNIIFEDESLIVVDKPAGLLTIATAREKERTLYALLWEHVSHSRPRGKIFIVHRLDRDASGLLVFAKSPEAKAFLQDQFKLHTAGRTYKALVEGRVAADSDTIRSYLAENRAHRCYSTTDSRLGKHAVTRFRVVKRSSRSTLLEVQLQSGRKHQIRVHMAEMGHPIVGDKMYGSQRNPLHRLALHAERLALCHPITGEKKQFESPCPKAFYNLP